MPLPVIYFEVCAACGGQVRVEEVADDLGTLVTQICHGCDSYFKFHLDPKGTVEPHAWTRERSARA